MPVEILNLEICIEEAERFLLRAKACLKDMRQAERVRSDNPDAAFSPDTAYSTWPSNVLSAAVRRSSMDLTRALAALRKY